MQAKCKEEIGERVKRARERVGLTQEELAQRIGISRISVYRYETGQREVPLGVLMLISRELGVSMEILLGEDLPDLGRLLGNRNICEIANWVAELELPEQRLLLEGLRDPDLSRDILQILQILRRSKD